MSSKSDNRPRQDAVNYDEKLKRDFITSIETNHGAYNLFIPTVRDLLEYEVNVSQLGVKSDEFYKLIAASLRIPYEQLLSWNLNDFATALNIVSQYMGGSSNGK